MKNLKGMQKELYMFMVESVQNRYIATLIESQRHAHLHLKNGHRLTGKLVGQTTEAIFFRHGITQMIHKAQINTINPSELKFV